MICDRLSSLLGLDCMSVADDGTIAKVFAPFTFDDGDEIPIYVQSVGDRIRFFDDGGVMMHFMGRGMSFEDRRKSKFIRTAVDCHGASFSDNGEVEVWDSASAAPGAFARYVSVILQITTWERDQRGANADLSLFIEEVAFCLRAWKPTAPFGDGPELEGITGQPYKLDFSFDGEGVVATSLHGQSINATVKKLFDIRSAPQNSSVKLLAVIDDRQDHSAATREALGIQGLASVMLFSRLEQNAQHRAPDKPN